MTVDQLKNAVLELDPDQKKEFILTTLPDLGREAVRDPAFLPQLLPVMLELVRESGMDLMQLLQSASVYTSRPSGPD